MKGKKNGQRIQKEVRHRAPEKSYPAQGYGRDGRFAGIERPYSREDVDRLRGTIEVEHTLARRGAEKLQELLKTEDFVAALGASTREHSPAIGGLHPHSKSVSLGPMTIVRLKCTFWHDNSLLLILWDSPNHATS